MYSVFFKRPIDLFLSCLLIILLFPIMVIVGLLLAIHNKGNPFFIQKRPGKHGKLFRLIKFKTMVFAVNSHGELLSDRERLKGLGKIIRKSSLDELPQLWNVLVGDMSLIGPRPLLEEYLPLYNAEQSRRHLVRPGITGLAQVNGRNSISWEKKFEFDVFYVNNLSLKLDIEILILTLMKFFRPEGINQKGHTTMPKFKGSR
ncbi:sugar transferase [Aquiflexum gelatinilyticum]|uniref:Sugar transferase n=1 Tax=Aquiflexum gelatinilyticum TaxID=2961943 RepID=A0A9X2P701_9BACT|nr:sugar transferase [Aquiflexum gelatinilyticum]MCR9015478.1 sugar transferase [Aquiflexum gelatinilyticum]